ncbi:MAG TPA: biopolymer transporter ExbD [Planctomycetota bacterium]
MASTQDPKDPVGIQVVPMVDVIFCLCVFFMCSMKVQALEGKFESWLPKSRSSGCEPYTPFEEIRVALLWDEANQRTIRKYGYTVVRDDAHLQEILREAHAGCVRLGRPETPAIMDAGELVPWHEVVSAINLAKRENIDKIEFAAGPDYEKR